MDFHAEVPLIALHGLVHLGIASLDMVLGRRCGMNDRGVDHGASLQQQRLLLQNFVDRFHELGRQPVPL